MFVEPVAISPGPNFEMIQQLHVITQKDSSIKNVSSVTVYTKEDILKDFLIQINTWPNENCFGRISICWNGCKIIIVMTISNLNKNYSYRNRKVQ